MPYSGPGRPGAPVGNWGPGFKLFGTAQKMREDRCLCCCSPGTAFSHVDACVAADGRIVDLDPTLNTEPFEKIFSWVMQGPRVRWVQHYENRGGQFASSRGLDLTQHETRLPPFPGRQDAYQYGGSAPSTLLAPRSSTHTPPSLLSINPSLTLPPAAATVATAALLSPRSQTPPQKVARLS